LRANLSPSKDWSSTRDLRDPVRLIDLRQSPDLVVEAVSATAANGPEPAYVVPWPKPAKGLRQLTEADKHDELVVRTLAAYMVHPVDSHLPSRPTVSGYRLGRPPPGWSYRHGKKSHEEHRECVRALVQHSSFSALVITDVQDCYGSIRLDRCGDRLTEIGAAGWAVEAAIGWMRIWQERDGVRGLPIGPEWSPTFAHAVLSAVDAGLVWMGYPHGRWSDDIAAAVLGHGSTDDALAVIDSRLATVDLVRSKAKTEILDDPDDAFDRVVDLVLSGLAFDLTVSPGADTDQDVRDVFEQAIEELGSEPRAIHRFRFALATMMHHRDPWAARRFEACPELMEIDPTKVGAYLSGLAGSKPDAVAALFPLLEQPPDDRSTAVQIQMLGAAEAFEWGAPEGRIFERAHDASRPEVLRWWAAEALAHSPSFSPDRSVVEALVAGTDQAARRHLLPLRSMGNDAVRRRCSQRVACRGPRLESTVRFLVR
jgi:hypothetical protein